MSPKANLVIPSANNFMRFFLNSGNKVCLLKFLMEEFSHPALVKDEPWEIAASI